MMAAPPAAWLQLGSNALGARMPAIQGVALTCALQARGEATPSSGMHAHGRAAPYVGAFLTGCGG